MKRTQENNQKRDYKSSLFVNMFGRNVNAKVHFLSLYNAIHDTNFKIGEVEIKPVMLDNVVYNNIENDVSMEINKIRKSPHGRGAKHIISQEFCLQNSCHDMDVDICPSAALNISLHTTTASSPTTTSTTQRKSNCRDRSVMSSTTATQHFHRKKS